MTDDRGQRTEDQAHPPSLRPVRAWLILICLLVIAMVALGGITRLTGSGLSMVTWEPLLGAIPPRTEAQWQERFAQYQQFPQYQKINRAMELPEFKRIFFWEYLHRLVGRLMGVVFLPPFLWFLLRRQVRGRLAAKLLLLFGLGGLQGALGWFMVKSGLVNDPQVSHLRLAAHLLAALLLLGYGWWLTLELSPENLRAHAPPPVRRAALLFLVLLVLQIIYGAFTAGLRAGYFFNTFPKMLGYWIPPMAFGSGRGLACLIDDPVTVQWLHRTLGWLSAASAFALWLFARAYDLSQRQRRALSAVLWLTLLQFGLGAATLLLHVPVGLAVTHQVNAALLLLAALTLLHRPNIESYRSDFL